MGRSLLPVLTPWHYLHSTETMAFKKTTEYYRQNPQQAQHRYGITFEDALAAVESDASVYSYLNPDVRNRDSQHNYRLLRACMAHSPTNLWRAHQPKNIPVDLLVQGLEAVNIWERVLENWVAYDNAEFARKFPKELELIKLSRQLGLTPVESAAAYNAYLTSGKTQPANPTVLELPTF